MRLPAVILLMTRAFLTVLSVTRQGDVVTVSPYRTPNTGTVLVQTPGGEQRRVTINAAWRVTITR